MPDVYENPWLQRIPGITWGAVPSQLKFINMLNRRFHNRTTFTVSHPSLSMQRNHESEFVIKDSNADDIPEVPPPTPALGQFKYPALCISKKTPSFYSIQRKNVCDIISRMNSKPEPREEECAIIQENHIETNSTVRNVYNTAGYVFPKSGETKMYLWQVPSKNNNSTIKAL